MTSKSRRLMRDVAVDTAEFGFLPLLIPAIGGLIGGGAQVYGQIKSAEAAEKAAKAQAEAAVKVAQARAAGTAEMMRRLAPILGLVVVGGTLLTVILVKRKKKGGSP